LRRVPTVEEARPAVCVACGAAARPAGGGVGLWGHGLRDRQIRGPTKPGATGRTVVVCARRYRCQRCFLVLIVVPCEVAPRRHYAATAIAFALALYGVLGQSHAAVREAVSDAKVVGVRAEQRWCTLRRWIDAVGDRTLWPALPSMPIASGRRQVAERAAMAIGAHAPPSVPEGAPAARAFVGAMHMA
jgi:hypothetical protein